MLGVLMVTLSCLSDMTVLIAPEENQSTSVFLPDLQGMMDQ